MQGSASSLVKRCISKRTGLLHGGQTTVFIFLTEHTPLSRYTYEASLNSFFENETEWIQIRPKLESPGLRSEKVPQAGTPSARGQGARRCLGATYWGVSFSSSAAREEGEKEFRTWEKGLEVNGNPLKGSCMVLRPEREVVCLARAEDSGPGERVGPLLSGENIL